MTAVVQPFGAENGGEPVLRLNGVSKRFSGVQALKDVRLGVRAGEVMALIGENGAGKSTLVKILTGIYQPDAGDIFLGGEVTRFDTPLDAATAGITAIHQEAVMFEELTVAENIFLGHQPVRGPFRLVDWRGMRRRARTLLEELEIEIAPDAEVKSLSIAERHLVSVAKALSRDARVLILDEPTASLSKREIESLFQIVRRLKDSGKAIIFISHKFEEIFAIADRYTVLRDSRHVGEGNIAEIDQESLVSLMVGRTLEEVFPKVEAQLGDTVLKVNRLGHDTEFDDISFELRRGEILGFYGLVGAGRTELMQALFGLSRVKTGTIQVDNRYVRLKSPQDAIRHGFAYLPESRQEHGVILPLSVRVNVTLPSLPFLSRGLFLSHARELELTEQFGRELSIKAASWEQPVDELSGGNQQKVVISKWLATEPKIMILDEPTKGIDIGSKAAVHAFMGKLVKAGLALIMVTSELEEVLGMADSIIVMHRGRIRGRFARNDASAEAIMRCAAGS